MYHRDWYDGVGDAVAANKCEKLGKRGLFSTVGAVFLCVMACYLSSGIFGAGALSSDVMPTTPSVPMQPSDEGDASLVMSWVYEETTTAAETDDDAKTDEHEKHIGELADEYIASHTPEPVP